jgi:hypothetical protein
MKRKVTRTKKPARAKPAGAKPAGAKPAGAKPAGAKPAGARPARKRVSAVASPRRAARPERDFVDGLMATSAEALGLMIDPAWRDGVKFHLRLVLSHATRVAASELPDDTEPAPVFHA